MQFTLLGDSPYKGDADPLDFPRLAEELKGLVIASRESTPFSIGIEAPWGMGKSTLMERLREELAREPDVVTVWFNAWSAEGADVLEGLIKTALTNVEPGILRKVARNERFKRVIRLSSAVAGAALRSGDVVDQLWERVASDPQARNELRNLVSDVMEAWREKGREGSGKLMVIFIDDLDRCTPETVFHLFEAIKVYLDAPAFVFVIGFDELVISDAILEQKKFSKAVTSRHYLEKIIQISYRIPRPDADQIARLFDVYAADSGTFSLFDAPGRDIVIQGSSRNPRKIKRFINSFVLDYQSDPQWQALGAPFLIKALILHMYFGEFASLFRDESRDWIEEFLAYLDVRTAARSGNQDGARAARALLAARYGFAPDASVESIEQELPEVFQALAVDRSFVDFLETLRDENERRPLVTKLQSAPFMPSSSTSVPLDDDRRTSQEGQAFDGLRIMLFSEHAESGLARLLVHEGAYVNIVEGAETVHRALLIDSDVDVLVWEGDVEAGLEHLKRLRSESIFFGPVIFVGRVTPSFRSAAFALDAMVVSNHTGLLHGLQGIVDGRRTSGGAGQMWGGVVGPPSPSSSNP